MKVTTVGIDLAKNVFQIHAVELRFGRPARNSRLSDPVH